MNTVRAICEIPLFIFDNCETTANFLAIVKMAQIRAATSLADGSPCDFSAQMDFAGSYNEYTFFAELINCCQKIETESLL